MPKEMFLVEVERFGEKVGTFLLDLIEDFDDERVNLPCQLLLLLPQVSLLFRQIADFLSFVHTPLHFYVPLSHKHHCQIQY